jgi:hypothetical protein
MYGTSKVCGEPTVKSWPADRTPWSQALFYGLTDGLGIALAIAAECMLVLDWAASSGSPRLSPSAAYVGAGANVIFWFLFFGIARTFQMRIATLEFRRSTAWQRSRYKILLLVAVVVVISGVLRLALAEAALGASVWGVLGCAVALSIYAGSRLKRGDR